MGKWKTVVEKLSVHDAVENAKTDLGILAEEIRSWEENMSGTGLENTQKYEQVYECADSLENIDMDFVEGLLELLAKTEHGLHLNEVVEVKFGAPRSRSESRSTRLARVIASLEVVQELCEKLAGWDAEIDEETETDQETMDSFNEYAENIRDAVDEMNSIEFPGMF